MAANINALNAAIASGIDYSDMLAAMPAESLPDGPWEDLGTDDDSDSLFYDRKRGARWGMPSCCGYDTTVPPVIVRPELPAIQPATCTAFVIACRWPREVSATRPGRAGSGCAERF